MASVISTTGYTSADYALWGGLAEALFFCAMMICGCSGSTAGGPKVFRYQLLLGAIAGEIKRLHSPSVVVVPRFQGQPVSDEVMGSVIAFMMMFFLTLGLGAVALVLLGLDPVTAISGAAACLSNVGPGLGPDIGPVRQLRRPAGPGDLGAHVPHVRRPPRAHVGLRALHRRVLAGLTAGSGG